MDKNAEFNIRFIANNDEQRARGLMFASPLDDNETALFIFPRNDRYGFWNNNVSFKLSLAFLDENQCIVDIKDLEAMSRDVIYPDVSAKYVVEAKGGIFTKLGINKGDYLILNNDSNTLQTIKKT